MRRAIDQIEQDRAQRCRAEVASRHGKRVCAAAELDSVGAAGRQREAVNGAAGKLHGEGAEPAMNVVDEHAQRVQQNCKLLAIPHRQYRGESGGGNQDAAQDDLAADFAFDKYS